MNRIALGALIVVLLVGAGFGVGWAWRGDRSERDTSTQVATSAQSEAKAQITARAQEHQKAATLAEIGDKHEQDREAAKAVPDAVVADLRAGNLRLRDDLATCSTARLSDSVTGAIERDAGAQLREEVAGTAIQIVRDADDQLRAAQAVIRADREGVTP